MLDKTLFGSDIKLHFIQNRLIMDPLLQKFQCTYICHVYIYIYHKYLDTLIPYHSLYIWTTPFYYLLMCLKTAGQITNDDDIDQN